VIAAALLVEIEQAGGTVWAEGGRLKFRGTLARLIPFIREQKAELLALLLSRAGPVAADSTAKTRPHFDDGRSFMISSTCPCCRGSGCRFSSEAGS